MIFYPLSPRWLSPRPLRSNHGSVSVSGLQGSWSVRVCCLHLTIEIRLCARGVSGVASFITTDEQFQ